MPVFAELLSERISSIGYPAIINAKFTPEMKELSIVAAARISNISGTSTGHTLLCAELN